LGTELFRLLNNFGNCVDRRIALQTILLEWLEKLKRYGLADTH